MTEFLSPRGRIVGGSVLTGRRTDFQGKPLTTQAGEPRIEYFMALAVPKNEANELLALIRQVAASSFSLGEPDRPNFSWKFEDGDSQTPNSRGRRPCDRAGYPGNIVFRFSSGFPPKLYDSQIQEIVDPNKVQLGDYLRVHGTIRGNDSSMQPGLYLNHDMVQFLGTGERIVTGPDARAVFGGNESSHVQPRPLPPNPPEAVPPPPSPPSSPRTTEGCPYTYEQLVGQGWTEDQMRANGWLA